MDPDIQLGSMIAHEVRRPLNMILLEAECALRSPEPLEAQSALRHISANARIGGKIIAEILSLWGPGKIAKHRIDVNSLIRELIESIDDSLVPQRVSLVFAADPGAPSLIGSPTAIIEILMNLIENAIAAIQERGCVSISARAVGDHVEITVQDDGAGIDPHNLSRIFEPFFTTKSDRGGTGLGLAICRRLVDAQGGTIGVTSQPGRGSRFCVCLPAAAAVVGDDTEPLNATASEGATTTARRASC